MTRFILRSVLFSTLLVAGIIHATAQTNPTPFSLAGGNYSFTQWDANSAAGTYPSNMVFHVFNQRIEPFAGTLSDAPKGDWGLAYNLTGDARLNGEGTNGMSFFQTGTAQAGNCGFVGEAVLALNTQGRVNTVVKWVGQVTASGTRPYTLRLQYRTSTAGAWVNAIGDDGNYVQVASATDGFGLKGLAWTMPLALENQALVQLRWVYFQDGNGSGGRPRIRLDDITVSSDSPVGTATGLKIYAITPQSPSVGTGFSVIVRPVDGSGIVKNVTSSTSVTISRVSGTGTITGTVSGVIPAGGNALTLSNVMYNVAESGVTIIAKRTSGDVLTDGTSNPFTVGAKAAYAILTGAWHQEWTGQTINPITVTVYKTDNTVDQNFSGTITASGSGLSGTTSVAAFRGVAVFSNLTLSFAGSQNLTFSVPGLPTQSTPTITVVASPQLTTNLVPQYVNGATVNGCNLSATMIPVYARVTFSGLQPNTTYRYNVGGNNVAGVPTSTGGGYNIHFDAATNSYNYSSSKSLTDAYSTFNSGNSTSKSLWINLLITNASNFATGQPLYWQVALGDYVGNLIGYYQLSQTSTLYDYGSAGTQITLIGDQGSQLTPKNYVVLWDNTAGTGRPVGIGLVQSYGTSVTSFAQARYSNDVENESGAWMTTVPNWQSAGVRRIEERDWNGNVVYSTTSANGMWNDVATYPADASYGGVPGGATTPIYLSTPKIGVMQPASMDTICSGSPFDIVFRADGMDTVKIEYSIDGGNTYSLINGNVPVNHGDYDEGDDEGDDDNDYDQGTMIANGTDSYSWVVPSVGFRGNCYIRITGVDRPSDVGYSKMFTIVEPLSLIGEVPSHNLCLGQTDTLIALVGGTAESFQWYKDGEPIMNALGPILFLQNVQYNASGVYWCEVGGYGDCGDVTTNQASIRVARQTGIVTQTFAVAGILGETATMSVTVEAPDDVTGYQWYRGVTPLVESDHYFGTRSNRLEIRNFANTDFGNDYYCIVTGVCGTATTRVIRAFPSGVYAEFVQSTYSGCAGANLQLDAAVYSNPPGEQLETRWYFNGTMITDGADYAGTQTATLTINNVSPALAGTYTVRTMLAVDNSIMSEASTNVVIATPATITTQPADVAVCAGDTTTLSVAATAQGTVTYQWVLNGTDIAGATDDTYMIANVSAANAGEYAVKITTGCGTVTSDNADVTVKEATAITTQPVATVSVAVGGTLSLNLTATGAGTLQYQWFHDGTAITGEIAPAYTKASYAAGDEGKYWCVVTGECGELTSDTTTVTTSPTSSVSEQVVGGALVGRLAPNPTANASSLSVTMVAPAMVNVTVVDASGSIVLNVVNAQLPAGDNRLPILTSQLASGVYTVQTVIGGERSVQQLVVLK